MPLRLNHTLYLLHLDAFAYQIYAWIEVGAHVVTDNNSKSIPLLSPLNRGKGMKILKKIWRATFQLGRMPQSSLKDKYYYCAVWLWTCILI